MANVKLFLSCVTDEFGDDRDELRRALTRPNVEIKIQEDFQAMGGDTLALLEAYVESCDVVVHFIGDMAGSTPKPSSVDDLLKRRPELAARLAEKGMDRRALGRLTYTQWEAWLAIGFNRDGAKQNLVIVTPTYGLKHGAKFAPTDATRASQADHLRWLRAINFYPAKPFTSADNLVARIFGSAVLRIARQPVRRPRRGPCRPAYGAAGREGRSGRAPRSRRGWKDAARDGKIGVPGSERFGACVRQRQRRHRAQRRFGGPDCLRDSRPARERG